MHVAPSATANGELEVYGAPPLSVVPSEQLRLQPTSPGNDPAEQVIAEDMVSGSGGEGSEGGEGGEDGEGGVAGGAGGQDGDEGGEGGDHDHAKFLIWMLCPPPPPTMYLNSRSSISMLSWNVSEKAVKLCGAGSGMTYRLSRGATLNSATRPFRPPHPWSFHFPENVMKDPGMVNSGLLT